MKNSGAMRFLTSKSKGQTLKTVMLTVFNVLLSVLSIFFALGVKAVIDGATASDGTGANKLLYGSIAVIVIILLQFVLRISINLMTEHVKGKLEVCYKSHLFSSILSKRYDKITSYHSGELMNRLTSDVEVCSTGVAEIIPDAVGSVAKLVCAFIALIILDPLFCFILLGAGVVVFLTIMLVKNLLKALHKRAQETDGKVRSFMQECIENLLAIKVFNANDKVEKDATDLQNENFKVKMRRRNVAVLGNAVYNVVFSLGYVFALVYGGYMIFNGKLGYGTLSAILQLVMNIQAPFASLSLILPRFLSTVASAERLMEIDQVEKEQTTDKIDAKTVYEKLDTIEFENITFGYGREEVLENASLTVKKGDFVAVTGLSGIGKSTLVKLLLGVYEPKDGKVYLKTNGENIKVSSATRGLFTFVPQGNMIFSGTLRENLTFINRDASEEEIEKALEIACLSQTVAQLPQGLETVVGENGAGLSEGQVQRVAIARALLTKAPILLLDEGTSALDAKTEQELLDNLKGLDGVTAIMITHKSAGLKVCNRTIKIEDKKIIEN